MTPGSGKSTWIKNHLASFLGYTKVVSRDQIRFSIIKDDEDYFSHETEVYNKFIEEIKDGLEYCDTTIADATHLSKSSRRKILNELKDYRKNIEIICVYMCTHLDTCLKRNEKRTGRSKVPRSVIRRMYFQIEFPSLEEGFDRIMTII